MMTALVGQKKVGTSGLVNDNRQEFLRGLQVLEEHFHNPISKDLRLMWLDCFTKDSIENWARTVQRCIEQKDHFPIPLEIRRIIDIIEKEKIKTLLKNDGASNNISGFLPGLTSDNMSEEYHQANQEFIKILTAGVNSCLAFKQGKSQSKATRNDLWLESKEQITSLQEKFSHLPSHYVCMECWEAGWYSRQEGDYAISYPCKCEKGFERQKEMLISFLNEKARETKQSLAQYLSALSLPGAIKPFKGKAYPCIAVFDDMGKWNFACQHQCSADRIKWCFLQVDVMLKHN